MNATPKAHPWTDSRQGAPVVKARIKLPNGDGSYTYRILGPWGHHRDQEKRVVADWRAGARTEPGHAVTIAELVERYLVFAKGYYRHRPIGENDRKPSSAQYRRVKLAFSYVLRRCATEFAADFGSVKLRECRDLMVEDGHSRKYINALVDCVRLGFQRSASWELVPVETYHKLMMLEPLKKGRASAPEGPGTAPTIPQEWIDRATPFMSRQVAAMVKVQYLCCMRPEEVCILRKGHFRQGKPEEVDGRKVEMWEYYPQAFKGDHLDDTGVQEVIEIGPKAQEALRPFLLECPGEADYLFSPRKAYAEATERRRKPPGEGRRQPRRRAVAPRVAPGAHYTPHSYRQSVHRACERAGVPRFNPKQIRHTKSTLIRAKYDSPDYAQAHNRHKHLSTTEIYAKVQREKARFIAARDG